MEPKISVRVEVLREVANRIFDFIERDLGKSTVDLPHNFYWSIPDDVRYKVDQSPGKDQLANGSLVDDLDFVTSAYRDSSQAIPLVLMHVAPLLDALATAVPNYKSPPEKK